MNNIKKCHIFIVKVIYIDQCEPHFRNSNDCFI